MSQQTLPFASDMVCPDAMTPPREETWASELKKLEELRVPCQSVINLLDDWERHYNDITCLTTLVPIPIASDDLKPFAGLEGYNYQDEPFFTSDFWEKYAGVDWKYIDYLTCLHRHWKYAKRMDEALARQWKRTFGRYLEFGKRAYHLESTFTARATDLATFLKEDTSGLSLLYGDAHVDAALTFEHVSQASFPGDQPQSVHLVGHLLHQNPLEEPSTNITAAAVFDDAHPGVDSILESTTQIASGSSHNDTQPFTQHQEGPIQALAAPHEVASAWAMLFGASNSELASTLGNQTEFRKPIIPTQGQNLRASRGQSSVDGGIQGRSTPAQSPTSSVSSSDEPVDVLARVFRFRTGPAAQPTPTPSASTGTTKNLKKMGSAAEIARRLSARDSNAEGVSDYVSDDRFAVTEGKVRRKVDQIPARYRWKANQFDDHGNLLVPAFKYPEINEDLSNGPFFWDDAGDIYEIICRHCPSPVDNEPCNGRIHEHRNFGYFAGKKSIVQHLDDCHGIFPTNHNGMRMRNGDKAREAWTIANGMRKITMEQAKNVYPRVSTAKMTDEKIRRQAESRKRNDEAKKRKAAEDNGQEESSKRGRPGKA